MNPHTSPPSAAASTFDHDHAAVLDSTLSTPTGPSAQPITVQELTAQLLGLPAVTHLEATEQGGAPESNWGNLFFYVEGDAVRPFATIVLRNMPGFDEESQLDRPGLFRLNIDLGREEFERQFGYPPARLAEHRTGIDFSTRDQVTPHPVYGGQGWAAILNPGPAHRGDVERLLRHAHHKALVHVERHRQRQHPGR